MAIHTICPHADCGQRYRVEESHFGQTVVCKRCGRQFKVAPAEQRTSLPAQETASPSLQHQADFPQQPEKTPERLSRFEIRSCLGVGAFGAVYRAYDPMLDREVAVKVPRAGALEHPEAKARFLREPKAAAKLSHPNIVPVFDAGSDGEQFYIASAFIEGRTLKAVLEDEPPKLRRTVQIVRQLAEALDYAHRMGVVHRDVKPANIILDVAGQPMLTDFGLARLATSSEEKLTQDGTVIGTPAYMAPEQADGSLGGVGPASDQYSLGVVLYEMLCGETPFTGLPAVLIFNAISKAPESPRSKDPTVPRDLETICLKAMSKRAGDRYASCGEMAEDLRRWLADEPIRARRMGIIERASRWSRRNPLLAALGLAAILLATVSTIASVGLFYSSQGLAIALESEYEQVAAIEMQKQKAEAQTRLAQEHERVAEEQEKVAKEAAEKLRNEIAIRDRITRERDYELQRQRALSEDLNKKDASLTSVRTERDRTRSKTDQAAQERQAMLAQDPWAQYTVNLSAADAAIQQRNLELAVKLLEACPKEHRAWEWQYLHELAKGAPAAREEEIHGSGFAFSVNPGRLAVFFQGRIGEKGLPSGVYDLPECTLVGEVPRYWTMNLGSGSGGHHLSPNGDTLWYGFLIRDSGALPGPMLLTMHSYDVASGREKLTKFYCKKSGRVSPDGKFVLSDFTLYSWQTGKALVKLSGAPKLVSEPPMGPGLSWRLMSFTPTGDVVAVGELSQKGQRPLLKVLVWKTSQVFSRRSDIPPSEVIAVEAPAELDISTEGAPTELNYLAPSEREWRVTFSADGKCLLIFHRDLCSIISVAPAHYLTTIRDFLSLSPDHRRAACLENGRVLLRNISSNRTLTGLASVAWTKQYSFAKQRPSLGSAFAFAPDWGWVAALLDGPAVRCWYRPTRPMTQPAVDTSSRE